MCTERRRLVLISLTVYLVRYAPKHDFTKDSFEVGEGFEVLFIRTATLIIERRGVDKLGKLTS